jgi:hypothetical protein
VLGSRMLCGWQLAIDGSRRDIRSPRLVSWVGECDDVPDSEDRSTGLRPLASVWLPGNGRCGSASASFAGTIDQVFFIRRFGGAELKAGVACPATVHIRQWVALGGHLVSSDSVHSLRRSENRGYQFGSSATVSRNRTTERSRFQRRFHCQAQTSFSVWPAARSSRISGQAWRTRPALVRPGRTRRCCPQPLDIQWRQLIRPSDRPAGVWSAPG